jgi:hypothetical protein
VRETGVSSYVYSPDAPYSPAARVDAVIAGAMAAAAIDTAKCAARIYHFQYVKRVGSADVDIQFIYGNGGTRPTQISYDVLQGGQKITSALFNN